MIDREKLDQETDRWLNRICKWRSILAGWQLGTRLKGDPECDAVRDHRELTLLLRVEVNALTGLLLKKGVFTQEEWQLQLVEECKALEESYQKRFPGMKSSDEGMDIDVKLANETTKNWKP